MTTVALNSEASTYWNYIKNASNEVKLTLISLLTASMNSSEEAVVEKAKPLKARRLNAMTDEEMEREMQDNPQPFTSADEAMPADIIEANRGKIAKGLERWL